MNKILKSLPRELTTWAGSGLLLIVFLLATNPLKLALPIVLIPFGVFFVWVRSSVLMLSLLLRHKQQPTKKMKVVASSIAAVTLLTITLQSLGQLSWRDISLILSLVLFLAFYFYKTDLI